MALRQVLPLPSMWFQNRDDRRTLLKTYLKEEISAFRHDLLKLSCAQVLERSGWQLLRKIEVPGSDWMKGGDWSQNRCLKTFSSLPAREVTIVGAHSR